ncbi:MULTISPECIES: DUF342 domain-containing protein [Paenibacillus]|uniref:DUF342 domain-containing protein n=1 Tax=Paenibacillus TaxID=44249 RepID=UPI0022B91486|nr:FapA family protein [Paenibacillus caseinilyticus]MCZ8520028.1 FapA family protein [Paenibacillus caseinilyticus]
MSDQTMPLTYYMDITVSDDKLMAYVQFSNCDEAFSVTKEQFAGLLEASHIVHGIDEGKVAEIVNHPQAFFLSKTVIATGDAPQEGVDGSIKTLFDLDDKSKRPLELEDGTVDYKEVTAIHNVRKGQLIAERLPAVKSIEGRAVTGEPLFSKDGKEARFKIGKNVVTDPDQLAMYAAIDGMVSKTDRDKINVFPIFEVNGDIDYNIGNIDFVGTVVIRGNVLPGFRVRAAGDIRITGSVEAADLEAEGSIEITAGILGHNKGLIRAGRRIKSSFVQDATVEAGEEVVITQSIMHSQIRAGRQVICTGAKGLIVGGMIQAGERVAARTIGNSMSTPTTLEVGVLPELRNELGALRTQLKVYMENLEKTDKALSLLDQLAAAGQLSPDKMSMRIKLNHTKKQGRDEVNTCKERILEIEKSLEDSERARVEALAYAYSGTKIVIGRYTKFVKDTSQRVRFMLQEGDIAMIPIV